MHLVHESQVMPLWWQIEISVLEFANTVKFSMGYALTGFICFIIAILKKIRRITIVDYTLKDTFGSQSHIRILRCNTLVQNLSNGCIMLSTRRRLTSYSIAYNTVQSTSRIKTKKLSEADFFSVASKFLWVDFLRKTNRVPVGFLSHTDVETLWFK